MDTPVDPLAQPRTWDLVAPGYASTSTEHFERYAADALAIARIAGNHRILDVATGPGSLALLASERVSRVDALDFSAEMLAQLRQRARQRGVSNVELHQGDGQNLPFDDDSFDAGFSMFGLMFFPDRAAGFSELHRVLKPGGRCVVSSWHPMDKVELLGAVFEALFAELPDLPRNPPAIPLGDPDSIREEMSAVGFEVEVHSATHAIERRSMDEMWAGLRRSFAPIVLLEDKMGQAFAPVASGIGRRLRERFGNGPAAIPMPAWLAQGRVAG